MCHLLHGLGTFWSLLPHHGRMCHRSLLGCRDHPAGSHCKVHSTLEIHSARHQRSNINNSFLHMVSQLVYITTVYNT